MFSPKQLLIFTLAATAAYVAAFVPDPRIFGGHLAKREEFTYQISLRYKMWGSFQHFCGGAIISERNVLTAAHCMAADAEPSSYKVVAGSPSLSEGGVVYEVENYVIHAEYDEEMIIHDIGLIRTKERIKFGASVHPIGLGTTWIDGGLRATFSGWGISNVSVTRNELRELEFYVSFSHRMASPT